MVQQTNQGFWSLKAGLIGEPGLFQGDEKGEQSRYKPYKPGRPVTLFEF